MAGLLRAPDGDGLAATSAIIPRSLEGEPTIALAAHYAEAEYLMPGTANMYSGPASGPARVASTGHRYLTRLLVRYPTRPTDFSGRVVVEPFNTTLGPDRDALWIRVGSLLQRNGDAWVGISERATSTVELQRYDAARYADVDICANDLAWDILREIGGRLKTGGDRSPLGDLPVRHVYLGGYSQSGVDTATFAAAFSQTMRAADGRAVYDGYFPAAHAASLTPLGSGAMILRFEQAPMGPVGVPVIDIEPQTDVEGFSFEGFINPGAASVRRVDSDAAGDRFRLYEVAGAPHAGLIVGCDDAASSYPTSAFVRAALGQLFRWVEDGITPPTAPRIALASDGLVAVASVDRYGNAVGGVPSPFLQVPLARYEVHSTPGPLCKLAGRETLLPSETLVGRYGTADAYVAEFSASLDAVIRAGFLRHEDRATILQAQTGIARQAFSAPSATDESA